MRKLNLGEWIGIVVALLVIGLFFNFGGLFLGTGSPDKNTGAIQMNGDTNTNTGNLQVIDLKAGNGEEALPGKKVTVNYIGTLTDGQKFDSSYDRNAPFTFDLGAGQVIRGWDRGVEGMKVGGKRKLVIPPDLGYGSQAIGPIPANSTLVFEVELLKVE